MKAAIRKELLAVRRALPPGRVAVSSKRITAYLLSFPPFVNARTVFVYASTPDEVQTDGLINHMLARGKRVAVPYTLAEKGAMAASELRSIHELAPGRFGIRAPRPEYYRPVPPAEIDLVIVPGVGFDRQGNRLGYGGGYYDRFLAAVLPTTVLVGLGFTVQLVDRLPADPNDIRMHYVITEQGIMDMTDKMQAP